MGVTIHYRGRLGNPEVRDMAFGIARDFAKAQGWACVDIPEEVRHLERMRDDGEWIYDGPTRGIQLAPHPLCEPFRFEVDDDLYLQDFTKTQFAPLDVHMALVELLHLLEPCFAEFHVEDEGGYFDSGDRDRLARTIGLCNDAIRSAMTHGAEVAFKLPSGRIADLYG